MKYAAHVVEIGSKGNFSRKRSVIKVVISKGSFTMFNNPFYIDDLLVFDDDTLRTMLEQGSFGLSCEQLAYSLHDASPELIDRVVRCMPVQQRTEFLHLLEQPLTLQEISFARKQLLDGLFWELIYWKTPALYEQLTEGECLHPGIFQQLASDICGKVVLDAGAGSGRASFECVRHGAAFVHAVEPSPGLLRIFRQKLTQYEQKDQLALYTGRFDALPLADNSVDLSLSCSAFTALPEQGGEAGLAELKRVTRPEGKIVFVWPRAEDRDWLAQHGFHYVHLPMQDEMRVRFRSWQSALQCVQRFYADNTALMRYLLTYHRPELPFSLIGMNPPHEYCWISLPA